MSPSRIVRKAEEVGGQELSHAEVKAIASGNPAVVTLTEANAELQRLAILHKNHRNEQYLARRNLRDLPGEIARLEQRLGHLTADMATAEAHRDDDLVIGAREIARDDVMTVLGRRLNEIPAEVDRTKRYPLGRSHGLEFGIILHHLGGMKVYVEGEATRRTVLAKDNLGARAVLNAVDWLWARAEAECEDYRADIQMKEWQLRDYEARVGTPFAHEDYAERLGDLRDKLELSLSEKPPEGMKTASKLAAEIQALRDGNAVEAAPERTARKAVRAERPVTARIRERLGMVEPAKTEPHGDEAGPDPVQVAAPIAEMITLPVTGPVDEEIPDGELAARPGGASGVVPAMWQDLGHAGRLARGRQGDEVQLRLF